MSRRTTRVQLELPEPSMERLKRLKEVTEASGYSEVIRNALKTYEALLDGSSELFLTREVDGKIEKNKVLI